MSSISLLRQESNLGCFVDRRIASTDTTIYLRFFNKVTGEAVEPHASNRTNLTITLDKDNENHEILVLGTVGAASGGVSTCTGVVRFVSFNGINLTAGTGKEHQSEAEGGCADVVNMWQQFYDVVSGLYGTGAANFRIGKDADENITIYAQNADGNEPFLRYDATANAWVVSHNGTDTVVIDGAGGVFTAGDGLTITASNIDIDLTDTVIFKDARTGNEKRIVITKAADGYIDDTFIKASNVQQYLQSSFTTGENIAIADAVRIKRDGLIYKAEKYANEGAFWSLNAGSNPDTQYKAACAVDTNKVVYIYEQGGNTFVVAVIWDGETPTVGTAVDIGTGWTTSGYVDVCKVTTDKFAVVHWADTAAGVDDGQVCICTVSTVTITAGTSVAFEGGTQVAGSINRVCSPATDVITVVWENADTGSDCYARTATIATTTPTFGAEVEVSGDNNSGSACDVVDIGTNKVVVVYKNTDNDLYARVSTISGNTMTQGDAVELADAITVEAGAVRVEKLGTDKFIVFYGEDAVATKMLVCTVSGTVVTPGTAVALETGTAGLTSYSSVVRIQDDMVFYAYVSLNKTAIDYTYRRYDIKGSIISVSGTVPTENLLFDSHYHYIDASTYNYASRICAVNLNNDLFQIFGLDATSYDNIGINIADNNFIGFADETIASGLACKVNWCKDDNQAGLITGAKYYLGANGAISLKGAREIGTAISATEILIKQ